jgi:hypothetical protein
LTGLRWRLHHRYTVNTACGNLRNNLVGTVGIRIVPKIEASEDKLLEAGYFSLKYRRNLRFDVFTITKFSVCFVFNSSLAILVVDFL